MVMSAPGPGMSTDVIGPVVEVVGAGLTEVGVGVGDVVGVAVGVGVGVGLAHASAATITSSSDDARNKST